ncbi:hypothetical protein FGW37_05290 [Streptomyces rectiverticillatus]|uniref:hypothetical protein n=1 Tax=Streptomyces rectiverticillatus TaxID=173860 RepID=UPI0015C3B475|nr:hypothetical protein [Streptomyces rectiverticillatus]QLE71095.1 hypothetical protein FGW37_05290 [Streptomyces rectiverticillatus]
MQADDFLMGGSGVQAARFERIGSAVTGYISGKPKVQQMTDFTTSEPLTWPNGEPKLQMIVTMATDQVDPAVEGDDGMRRIYVKGQMKKAVADAVRQAGARGLEEGGLLTVTYVRDGRKTNPKFKAPKEYSATYQRPAVPVLPDEPTPTAPPMPQPAAVAPQAVWGQQPAPQAPSAWQNA